jgi:hypothetical protein
MSQDKPQLPIEHIHFNDEIPLEQGQKDIFAEIIEWRTTPPIVKTGRSTYLITTDENLPFKGIKIKGCGYFDVHNKTAEQPSTKKGYDAYRQDAPDGIKEIHYQIEVDDNDELKYSIPAKRPYGAQLYNKAKLEYEVNEKLIKSWEGDMANLPFYLPIAYAKYKDMYYKNDPLGVTILGMPNKAETHLGACFSGKLEEEGMRINPHLLEYWQNHLAVVGKNNPDYFDLITALKKLCYEFGESLSYLHEYYVDFDSHLFNAAVNNDNGKVILFDFDHVFDNDELSDQAYFYYALKDFEIGLVAILSNFLLSGLAEGVTLFEKINQPIDDFNIIEGFYKGYFGKSSELTKKHAKSIWERLLTFTANNLLSLPQDKQFHLVYDFCEQERDRSYIDVFSYFKEKIQKKRPKFELTQKEHESVIIKLLKQKKELQKRNMEE